jgi:peptidoglycan/LPS O-acetylase OafA/YrhL
MKTMLLKDLVDGKKNNFNFLRFMAAFLVIFSHSFTITGVKELFAVLSKNQQTFGGLAVDTFLIISGFLVTLSFQRSKDSFSYWKGRFLRIFPGLIVVVLLCTFLLGPLVTALNFHQYITNPKTYTYLQAISLFKMQYFLPGVFEHNVYPAAVNGSIWSLVYEFGCYIIIAVIGFCKLLDKKVVVSLFLTSYLMHFLSYTSNVVMGHYITFITYFMAGAVFYLSMDTIKISFKYFIIALVLLVMSTHFGYLEAALPIFGSYIIIYLAFCPKIKLHNFARYGDLSYGIYIYAFPIQQLIIFLFGGKMNSYLNFVIAVPFVLIFAFLSWHLVENPCLRLKNKSFNLPFFRGGPKQQTLQ